MTLAELQKALAAEVAACEGEVSLLWQTLPGEILFSHEAEYQMVSASVIKVPILAAALARVQRGEAAMSTLLPVTESYILEDTIPFETGPREATLEELLTWMTVYSDNTSTNVLIDWLGMDEVNAFCASIGLTQTSLQRHMLDHAAIERGYNNYTSAGDMYKLFKAIFEDTILTPALCAAARHILHKQRHDKLMRRYLWEEYTLAHKTGGLNYLSHDVGVFTLGGRQWYLGVFVQKAPDESGDRKFIGRVTRLILDYYLQKQNGAKHAIVASDIAPLYTQPTTECELADEALHGMVVEVLDRPLPGWCLVRTPYRYEGYVPSHCLFFGDEEAEQWRQAASKCVTAPYLDIMKQPKVQAAKAVSAPRGSLVMPQGEPEQGWQRLRLPDGLVGYARASHLGEYVQGPLQDEQALRKALVDTALSYRGTQYRWGGKTPLGIDCSGLTSMAYLLNGVVIYRDAKILPEFALHEIPLAQIKPGDLLFFPGHVAMYIGNDEYVHSTGFAGADGVVINSLNPQAENYREDLHKGITEVGSIF